MVGHRPAADPAGPPARRTTGRCPRWRGATTEEAIRPILRHQDRDLYFREHFDRLGIGYYGHRPMPIDAGDVLPPTRRPVMPSVLRVHPGGLRARPGRDAAAAARPARTAKVEEGINGLFSFTPDGMPAARRVAATSRASGSPRRSGSPTRRASAGAMAEWLVDGDCATDLHECDVNRFEPHQLAPAYVLDRGCQNFVEVYDILHPLQPMEQPRPLRTSPFYAAQQELGARLPRGQRLGAAAVVRGQRRRCWSGCDDPGPGRLGGAVLVADRRRRGAGDPRAASRCTT